MFNKPVDKCVDNYMDNYAHNFRVIHSGSSRHRRAWKSTGLYSGRLSIIHSFPRPKIIHVMLIHRFPSVWISP